MCHSAWLSYAPHKTKPYHISFFINNQHPSIRPSIHPYIHVHPYIYTYTHAYVRTHAPTHTHSYIHTCIHVRTYLGICLNQPRSQEELADSDNGATAILKRAKNICKLHNQYFTTNHTMLRLMPRIQVSFRFFIDANIYNLLNIKVKYNFFKNVNGSDKRDHLGGPELNFAILIWSETIGNYAAVIYCLFHVHSCLDSLFRRFYTC